jgi:hypothetical protein
MTSALESMVKLFFVFLWSCIVFITLFTLKSQKWLIILHNVSSFNGRPNSSDIFLVRSPGKFG